MRENSIRETIETQYIYRVTHTRKDYLKRLKGAFLPLKFRRVIPHQIPPWKFIPLRYFIVLSALEGLFYMTNEPFNPDLFRVYSPRWVAFTTAKESHLPHCDR